MSPKEIVAKAKKYVIDMFADEMAGVEGDPDVRLEEITHNDDRTWDVTVSFLERKKRTPPKAKNPIQAVLDPSAQTWVIGVDAERSFKVVRMDAAGNVVSVTVRTFNVSA